MYHNIIENSKLRRLKMRRYVMNRIEEMRRERQRINAEYAAAYRRCFEGTPDEIAIKLNAWDGMHESTRSRPERPSYGLLI